MPVNGKFSQHEWTGPYRILNVFNNGSVRIRHGAVSKTINIQKDDDKVKLKVNGKKVPDDKAKEYIELIKQKDN